MSSICRLVNPCSRLAISNGRIFFDLSLYLIANRPSFKDEHLFFSKIQEAVKGGVTCVQLRDYKSDFPSVLNTATRLKKILEGLPLFINTTNSLEIALRTSAEGIYLEENIPLSEVRKTLGQKTIIGAPVKTMSEVLLSSQNSEIDYLSVKVFPSKQTCPKNNALWGIGGLEHIRAISPKRIVAIGGIDLSLTKSIYKKLYLDDGIAMAGGLMREDSPFETAKKITALRQKVRSET